MNDEIEPRAGTGALPFAVPHDMGSIVIDGEIGTGKTMLLSRVLAQALEDPGFPDVAICYDERREHHRFDALLADPRVHAYTAAASLVASDNGTVSGRAGAAPWVFVDAWSSAAADAAARLAGQSHVVLATLWPVDQAAFDIRIHCRSTYPSGDSSRNGIRYLAELNGQSAALHADVTLSHPVYASPH
ncbi:MAG: hypothetical protein ABF966_09085 [Bifidobacterium psychraerophilum]|uniref:hypothetical protein n=1 Tax=Bifidobacterium psychraerophilum TaxID=218140 RepID=UPI0039EAD803